MLFSHLHRRILHPRIVFLDLRFLQQQLKVGVGLALFISLFTIESTIVLSLITLYFYLNTFFPYRKKQLGMHREEENLTENHTNPMVSRIHTKQ
jgi:hypothetical protein